MIAWFKVPHRVELGRLTPPAAKGRIGGPDQFVMLNAAEYFMAGDPQRTPVTALAKPGCSMPAAAMARRILRSVMPSYPRPTPTDRPATRSPRSENTRTGATDCPDRLCDQGL